MRMTVTLPSVGDLGDSLLTQVAGPILNGIAGVLPVVVPYLLALFALGLVWAVILGPLVSAGAGAIEGSDRVAYARFARLHRKADRAEARGDSGRASYYRSKARRVRQAAFDRETEGVTQSVNGGAPEKYKVGW